MKKNINITLIVLCIIIFIVSIFYNNYYFTNKEIFEDSFFTCTLQLDNIDPKFKDEYMQYNNKIGSCGVCSRAKLNVIVNTCPIDENGSPDFYCNQKATVTSSFGNAISFDNKVNPINIKDFFCL